MLRFQLDLVKSSKCLLRKDFLSTTSAGKFPSLEVTVRDMSKSGSRKSRVLRKGYISLNKLLYHVNITFLYSERFIANLVPGVVYGNDEDNNVIKQMITIPQNELMRELRQKGVSFENTVYELTIKRTLDSDASEGTDAQQTPSEIVSKFLVTPRQTQFNPGKETLVYAFIFLNLFLSFLLPVSDLPVSVNFLRYAPGKRVRVPVEYINQEASQDMRRGCFLVGVNSFVELVCDEDVPAKITVDLSNAKKGDIIRLSSIALPPKVRPAKSMGLDYVLGVVQTSRG